MLIVDAAASITLVQGYVVYCKELPHVEPEKTPSLDPHKLDFYTSIQSP